MVRASNNNVKKKRRIRTMRKSIAILMVVATIALAVPAFAELQNVLVGGAIRVRGDWWTTPNSDHALLVQARDNNLAFVEQRTRLNVRADFTDAVSAFIELDAYNQWGDSFRSNYLTGVDSRAGANDRVALYQGYIEANEMWGTGLYTRIGRQELKLGSGWLVGTNDKGALFTGLSFDAVRMGYKSDKFTVDGFMAKLADTSPISEDGDVDMYGVYASFIGIENVALDAYWLFVRDAKLLDGTLVGGSLDTHTFGLRGAGTFGGFDFEAEAAYQLLNYDVLKPRLFDLLRTKSESSDAWAGNLELGYTFDASVSPRIFVGGVYFEGADHGNGDFGFNRLFSNWKYSQMLELDANGAALSDFFAACLGFSIMPVESLKLQVTGTYLGRLVQDCEIGADDDNVADLGIEVGASAKYMYTSDLSFEVGYAHLFAGDGLTNNGSLSKDNSWGDPSLGGDLNYYYVETTLKF